MSEVKAKALTGPLQIFEKQIEPTKDEFLLLRDFIRQLCGISLGDDKLYLITQRLGPMLKEEKLKTFSELHQRLAVEQSGTLKERVIEAITTNETSFFRDGHPFEAFKDKLLPDALKSMRLTRLSEKGRKLKIWCAAASTGQEPYTFAILIAEALASGLYSDFCKADFSILATDISKEVLDKAAKGRYSQLEIIRGMSEELRSRHFTESSGHWTISHSLRQMVEFRQMNLIKPFQGVGIFDIISCRNVLIYFDDATKKKMLNQFYDALSPGGVLLLGAMENTYCLCDKFHVRRLGKTTVYDRRK